jgi:hypothetical protein
MNEKENLSILLSKEAIIVDQKFEASLSYRVVASRKYVKRAGNCWRETSFCNGIPYVSRRFVGGSRTPSVSRGRKRCSYQEMNVEPLATKSVFVYKSTESSEIRSRPGRGLKRSLLASDNTDRRKTRRERNG